MWLIKSQLMTHRMHTPWQRNKQSGIRESKDDRLFWFVNCAIGMCSLQSSSSGTGYGSKRRIILTVWNQSKDLYSWNILLPVFEGLCCLCLVGCFLYVIWYLWLSTIHIFSINMELQQIVGEVMTNYLGNLDENPREEAFMARMLESKSKKWIGERFSMSVPIIERRTWF